MTDEGDAKLKEFLAPGEKILKIVKGALKGAHYERLVVTDRRAIVYCPGFLKRNLEDFYYDKISSVEYHEGIISNKIKFHVSSNVKEVDWLAPKEDARAAATLIKEFIAKAHESKGSGKETILIKCTKCGGKNSEEAKFCASCGKKL